MARTRDMVPIAINILSVHVKGVCHGKDRDFTIPGKRAR